MTRALRDSTARRAARGFVWSVLLMGLWGGVLEAAEPPLVRLLATGGTIANRPGQRLTAEELIDSIPGLNEHVTVETEQFSNVSSAALTLDDWLRLSTRVNALLAERPELAGVVVTSGTDTLEETAFFLHLTVRSDRPVVVVGAMRNPSLIGYDGPANLLQAFRVAASPESRGRGTLVVLNGQINSARDVTKSDTHSLETFTSRERGILGLVDRDRVLYYRHLDSRHTSTSEFDVSNIDVLPRVDIVMVYQGASGDFIRSLVVAGARGIVVASAGAGATTREQRDALAEAARQGRVVVISSRTGGGRVARPADGPQPGGGEDRGYPRVYAEDLTPLKARILLMLGLTRSGNVDELQRMFAEY